MASLGYLHPDLANGRWAEMSLAMQIGNIGSEVSRALKWQAKGKDKLRDSAIDRALELYDLSIEAHLDEPARLKAFCRLREEFCDYFFGGNTFHTDPVKWQRYYDQFVGLERHL